MTSRDALGRRVREVWIAWAERQPDPKPSWLVPYDDLGEADKEADRCLGSALWGDGFAAGVEAAGQCTPCSHQRTNHPPHRWLEYPDTWRFCAGVTGISEGDESWP